MRVREVVFGVPGGQVAQGSNIKEQTWDAIWATENGGPPPPPGEFKFPWWLVGVGAVAAVAIRTKQIMKKGKRS